MSYDVEPPEPPYVPATGSYNPRQFVLSRDGKKVYERLTDGSWARVEPALAAYLQEKHKPTE